MKRGYYSQLDILWTVFSRQPDAVAYVRGSEKYLDIRGVVKFFEYQNEVLVVTEMMGLPTAKETCKEGIYAMHIHEGNECRGTKMDPFADTGMHYNPKRCQHPYHAGDMPSLFENDGYALSVFLTNRFKIAEIMGKTVIVHANVDDFHTQPSGNAGEKIACGEIIRGNSEIMCL